MGISRACASKWVKPVAPPRCPRPGGPVSVPHGSPNATPVRVIELIETWRRDQKWSGQRITHELAELGVTINRRTITRHLTRLGLGQRRFLDPSGDSNREPGQITARWPGRMVHLDVKKVGRIPAAAAGGSTAAALRSIRAVDRANAAGAKAGYVNQHSIVDGFSRLVVVDAYALRILDARVGARRTHFAHRLRRPDRSNRATSPIAAHSDSCCPAISPTIRPPDHAARADTPPRRTYRHDANLPNDRSFRTRRCGSVRCQPRP